MADEVDQAESAQQLILDAQIKAASGKPLDMSNPSGECLYCGEPTGTDRRWCDAVCCRMWGMDND